MGRGPQFPHSLSVTHPNRFLADPLGSAERAAQISWLLETSRRHHAGDNRSAAARKPMGRPWNVAIHKSRPQITVTGRRNFSSAPTRPGEPAAGETASHDFGLAVKLKNLRHNNGSYGKITDQFLGDPEFLKLAYFSIKSKPGNTTRGISSETFDGLEETWFANTALEIRAGTFQFQGSRRILINKRGSSDKRPLTIGSPKDKIIQKAMQIILNHIYEINDKDFSKHSHGFRPRKSCHTALYEIKKYWSGIP